jgi:intracellular sulfur oxidation DsrE/DsrF family protein
MMSSPSRPLVRTGLLAAAVVGALAASPARSVLQATSLDVGLAATHDAWLAALKGKHRQLFDAPASAGGIPLVHMMNYYDTYNSAYGVADRDINGVLTFYGSTTFHGLTDAMWAKYRLGEFLGEKDAAGTPFTANPWRTAPTIVGMTLPQASIEALQKRGGTFIICNNALTIFSGLVAKARGLEPKAVYADMKANILPNVTLVPAMVIAIEKAQAAGLAYHRQ